MSKLGVTEAEATRDFLYSRLKEDPAYKEWAEGYTIPDYITDNIARDKKLRPYQEEALKAFIWTFKHDRETAKHLLFNMATGTGKTLVMACCVLYLYAQGYRNFVFTVARENIISQAERNLTDAGYEKYLFNRRGVRFNGRRIGVNRVNSPADGNSRDINFTFIIINSLYNRLTAAHENQISLEDFKDNKTVIIADEAHHLNANTKSKKKSEADEARNWESVVDEAITANKNNMLLEFTATVDLKDANIRDKYRDKLVYRYDFAEFNRDGYSKEVKFLYNLETQVEDQKRYLIVNAVALSEYRRLLAERTMGVDIKPVVLIKSRRIADSEADRKFFDNVIDTLSVDDLKYLKSDAERNENGANEFEFVGDMFRWIESINSGLLDSMDSWSKDKALANFIVQIKNSFAHDNTLIYNSKKKEKPELLTNLDDPRNNIRAIFSVNALNEGWDVLSLYDIVHFDISASKKVSLQDIQLIGRGARLLPYKLPARYHRDSAGTMTSMAMFSMNTQTDKYKRKFDYDPNDTGRILETLVYHFTKTGTFMDQLQRELMSEGIVNSIGQPCTITMKPEFTKSDTYRNGIVLGNKLVYRKHTPQEEIDTTVKQSIVVIKYQHRVASMTDKEQDGIEASQHPMQIRIDDRYFSYPMIRKALVVSENGFFSFKNLRKHLPDIKSIDDFIYGALKEFRIEYRYDEGHELENLEANQKYRLLVDDILPKVRAKIDTGLPQVVGSRVLKAMPVKDAFSQSKTTYLAAYYGDIHGLGQAVVQNIVSPDERSKPQTNNENFDLRYDVKHAYWYAYDENYGTSEEKRFVKWLGGMMPELKRRYPGCEIYLIRNELDYSIYSPHDGRRFAPDYLLIINDVTNKALYYQVIIEPKGGHLLLKDEWKEDLLKEINNQYADGYGFKIELSEKLKQQGYKEENIKPIGLPFYTHTDKDNPDQERKFEEDFYRYVLK